jgi:hypothetical protein
MDLAIPKEKWQPQPIEVWQEIFKDTNNESIRDILRSWQYERDMVADAIMRETPGPLVERTESEKAKLRKHPFFSVE